MADTLTGLPHWAPCAPSCSAPTTPRPWPPGLRADGHDADVVIERLAGEDDDEDHPWAVVSDAPAFVVELLVDEYDGWVDDEAAPPTPSLPPLDLPSGPRRIKRPAEDSGRRPSDP